MNWFIFYHFYCIIKIFFEKIKLLNLMRNSLKFELLE